MRRTKTFFKLLFENFTQDGAMDLAAQLAYFFLLALFPFFIFVFTLLPYIGLTQDEFLNLLDKFAPDELMTIVNNNSDSVFQTHSGLMSFGVLATIWSISTGVSAVMRALNKAYNVEEERNFFVTRLIAVALTIGLIIVLAVALVLTVFGPVIGRFLLDHVGVSQSFINIWNIFRLIVGLFIIFLVFCCLYYFSPNKKLVWRDVLWGAIFAAVGWQVVSFAFSFYVSHFSSYSSTYGTLGGIIILMTWFYLTGVIIVLGGEINAVLRYMKKEAHDT